MITQLLRRVEKILNKNKKIIAKRAKKSMKDFRKKIQLLNRKYVRKMVAGSIAIKMVAYVTILTAISANYQPTVVDAQVWNSHIQFDQTKATALIIPSKTMEIKVVPIVPPAPVVKKRTITARERAIVYAPVVSAPVGEIQAYAQTRSDAKFGPGHFSALQTLWQRESGWNSGSTNRSSGACGIPQANPCSKAGGDYRTNANTQVEWGLNYIAARYGTPSRALAFWQSHHWY